MIGLNSSLRFLLRMRHHSSSLISLLLHVNLLSRVQTEVVDYTILYCDVGHWWGNYLGIAHRNILKVRSHDMGWIAVLPLMLLTSFLADVNLARNNIRNSLCISPWVDHWLHLNRSDLLVVR